MTASNGSLVASIAIDDPDAGSQLTEEVQAFKVGINKPRSRGDREEVFGGLGASWKGAFVEFRQLLAPPPSLIRPGALRSSWEPVLPAGP